MAFAAVAAFAKGGDSRDGAGDFRFVSNPSGCGKSALLYVLGGLTQASRGRVLVDGNDLVAMNDAEWTNLRRQTIGIVIQRFNLLPTLDVRHNIAIAQDIHGDYFDPDRFDVVTNMRGLKAAMCRRASPT
jgi:putative ABC transport system ATP-binding protein